MKKLSAVLLSSLLLILLLAGSSFATHLDFGIFPAHPAGAVVSYDGMGGALSGRDISVDSVTSLDTPLNSGVTTAIQDGILTFETGSFAGNDTDTWFFGAGGSIEVIGSVDFPDMTTDIVNDVLLEGEFNEAKVVAIGDGSFEVTIASFVDVKNENLLKYYGLPTGTNYLGNMNLSFWVLGGVNPPDSFSSSAVFSGNIVNTQAVPDASVAFLLGSAFLLGFAVSRRKVKE